jgi:alkyldihydroxyacetonephosphate synthase
VKVSQAFGPASTPQRLPERRITTRHFPQSFEYSCVGGWVMTRGAGGQSTGYGKIEHMVICMRVVTPRGVIETKKFPADAIGPDMNILMA